MDNASKFPVSETGIFELPGEPAIVINGVPEIWSDALSPSSKTEVQQNTNLGAECLGNSNFGEWLEGREVQKLFGNQYYTGIVTQFDKETGWYRVEYEDGDFEDLEWHELETVLLPLDITVPLKSMALKVIKKGQKSKPPKSSTIGATTRKAKSLGNKGTEDQVK